jgi:glutathione S-transferase
MLLLEHKRIPYSVVTLPTGLHPWLVRAAGFPGSRRPLRSIEGASSNQLARLDRLGTVPALRYGKQRIQTNGAIVAFLEQIAPDPPLYPADPEQRARVEEARVFGDEPLQMAVRRAALAAACADLQAMHERGGDGRLGALLSGNELVRRAASRAAGRFTFRAGARRSEQLGREVEPLLDRVDAWVAAGVLGAEQPNVADLTIAPSLALLDYRLDMRAGLRARPCYALVERLVPEPA